MLRDGHRTQVLARELVPGDVLFISEGDRIPADARLIMGGIEVDMSALTGESSPVERAADDTDTAERPIDSPVLVFSGTTCVSGSAVAAITAPVATPNWAGSRPCRGRSAAT